VDTDKDAQNHLRANSPNTVVARVRFISGPAVVKHRVRRYDHARVRIPPPGYDGHTTVVSNGTVGYTASQVDRDRDRRAGFHAPNSAGQTIRPATSERLLSNVNGSVRQDRMLKRQLCYCVHCATWNMRTPYSKMK